MQRLLGVCCVSVAVVLGAMGGMGAEVRPVREGGEEVLYLDSLADPDRWGPAECAVTAEKELLAEGRPTLLLHIPVDHESGEAKYPIGWPRMYTDVKGGAESSWAEYDRFEFQVHTRMTRDKVPGTPLNFQMHCPSRPQSTDRNLAELVLDEWVRIVIPTADIGNVGEIARLGFNISESNYRHGEVLDFRIGGFRLLRSATCRVDRMEVLAPAIYADRGALPVELVVSGPPANVSRGVPFALHSGGRLLRRETLPVRRGRQALTMDVSELRLGPGEYELVAFEEDGERCRRARFTVVSSPWEEP
ncbi:MAG: hypothetical protein JXR77_13425, partial [Lentisphaeria bacterium]|nr:hypothetical protein [Lentisphaeria bacterium]